MCLEDIGRVAAEHLLAINGEPVHCALPPRGAGLDQGRGTMSGPYRARGEPPGPASPSPA